jgi:hypothetical protein
MTTATALEKLVEEDISATFHKDLSAGCYAHCTKQDFHEIIEAFASDIQSPGETAQQAYVRTIEMTDIGKSLYKAYKSAPDTSPRAVEKYKLIAEIQNRADERFPELKTPQQRFAHAIDVDPHRRPYDKIAHSLYQVAKIAPGRDIAPAPAEPTVDFQKADAASRGSAHEEMLSLARQHRAANPRLTDEQAYAGRLHFAGERRLEKSSDGRAMVAPKCRRYRIHGSTKQAIH